MARKQSPGFPVEGVVSAGGIVWGRLGDEVQIVVCGRQARAGWVGQEGPSHCVGALARAGREQREGWVWSLPKGHVNPGESVEQAALRGGGGGAGLRGGPERRRGPPSWGLRGRGWRVMPLAPCPSTRPGAQHPGSRRARKGTRRGQG